MTNGGSTSPVTAKIEVRDLSLTFPGTGNGTSVSVLRNVNLAVHSGEFVCIVGPSGCGKTTLLNTIAGFIKSSDNNILIDGQPVHEPDRRRVFIFQENGVFPWLTVRENIGFGISHLPARDRQELIDHYIEVVNLTGFERAYPGELSGGMKQRVEIARALVANPDVLYMDEPFGALDYFTRLRMRAELVSLWEREKITVLFVTHDVEEAVQLADRVVIMTQRPSTIRSIVTVSLQRPRDIESHDYIDVRNRIFETMGYDHSGLGY